MFFPLSAEEGRSAEEQGGRTPSFPQDAPQMGEKINRERMDRSLLIVVQNQNHRPQARKPRMATRPVNSRTTTR